MTTPSSKPPPTSQPTLDAPPIPKHPTPEPESEPEPNVVSLPSYSSWFKWSAVHEVEYKNLREFFDRKSLSKTPAVYKYYRNAIIKNFRSNPSRKLTFTEARRTIVGDVGAIRRVFDFLETWGLVNYSPQSGKQTAGKGDDKDNKSSNAAAGGGGDGGEMSGGNKARKWCSGCKTACTIACFVCDKYDLVLCARCYVRGNYSVGVSSTEFRRVEISEPAKTEWSDKDTLQLLEAVMHYGDDWKRVAEHVSGRSEKDCVARFVKLPFGEKFVEPVDLNEAEAMPHQMKDQNDAESDAEPIAKKMRLTPLADASNPIMAQAAFLSALAGVEVSEAAAQAAVATVYEMDQLSSPGICQSQVHPTKDQDLAVVSTGNIPLQASEEARGDAELKLKQEEDSYFKSISTITEVKMKEIINKIGRFEEKDLQLEREWQQLRQMNHQLFMDMLTLLFHKTAPPKTEDGITEDKVRTELAQSS